MHQIRREKLTTILEVIARCKRNIKQNRNWFYFNFSVESSSFIFNNFKTEKFKNRPVCQLFGFTSVSGCQNLLQFHPRTRIVTALRPSLLFRYFSLFLLHLRTLAQEKMSENCLRLGTGGPSLCLYPLLSRNIIFCPALTMAARAKKAKRFAHAITGISVHYRDFEHAYAYVH